MKLENISKNMSGEKTTLLIKASSIENGYVNLSLDCDETAKGEYCDKKKHLIQNNPLRKHEDSTIPKFDQQNQRTISPPPPRKLGHRLKAMRKHLNLSLDGSIASNDHHHQNQGYCIWDLKGNESSLSGNDASDNRSSFDISSTVTSSTTTTLDDSMNHENSASSIDSSMNNINASFCIQSPDSIFEKFYKTFRDDVIRQEIKLLSKHHQEGVWVTPSSNSLQVWFGVVVVKQGPYQDGVFHFTVYFKDDFPESVPIIRFRSRVFHPQVEIRKGTFNTSMLILNDDKLKLPVKRQHGAKGRIYVWQLLKYLRESFYHVEVTGATNETAAILYRRGDKREFLKECQHCVQRSIDAFNLQKVGGRNNDSAVENIINNPLKGTLVDDDFYNGFVRFLVANEDRNRNISHTNGASLRNAIGWAKGQLGRVLNNLNTSYSLIDGDEID